MADGVLDFFDDLGQRGHVPLLERLTATIRVELERPEGADRWLVTVDRGDVSVSRRNAKADCVIRTDRQLFADMVRGRVNAMAAFLRGAVGVEGDPNVLVLFQRVFPGPQGLREG
jgi:putative sterol carrier protein